MRVFKVCWYIGVFALALMASGVIPAIVPQSVPAAFKFGSTGQQFQIATGSTPTAGNCATWDANHNLIDSGINLCGGSGGTAVNTWNGATGTVVYSIEQGGTPVGTNRLKLNFIGATVADNAGTSATDVTITPAVKPVSVVQGVASSTSSVAFTVNVTSGNYLFVVTGTNTAFPTIADTLGTTFTAIDSNSNVSGNFGKMWFGLLASSGADTITLTSGTVPNVAAFEMIPPSGFTGTLDNHTTNNAGNPVSIATTAANGLVVVGIAFNHTSVTSGPRGSIIPVAQANSNDSVAIGLNLALFPAASTVQGGLTYTSGAQNDAIVIAGAFH